jgi:hypothetical protein
VVVAVLRVKLDLEQVSPADVNDAYSQQLGSVQQPVNVFGEHGCC